MPRAVRLIRPLERTILAGHPWLYREALQPFEAPPGELVDVFDKRGRLLARGFVDGNPIAVRLLTTRTSERIGPELFQQRIEAALHLRAELAPEETSAYRLIHGEGDRLPGLVCDRYGDFAVIKLDGEGCWALRDTLRDALREPLAARGIRGALLRSSRKQGLEAEAWFGDEVPRELEVSERGMRLLVNPWEGQKTGLFLDHRESRARVRTLARSRRVLNLYAYTGGFSVAAGLGGAEHVTSVDLAKPAIELAGRTWLLNGLPESRHLAQAEDVEAFVTRSVERGDLYQLVIADPPNFAPSQAKLDVALETYATLHAACLRLVTENGLYLAASCSSHVRSTDFLETLREGARRAKRVITLLEQAGAPFDHPRLVAFPEGDYLKVFLCRVA